MLHVKPTIMTPNLTLKVSNNSVILVSNFTDFYNLFRSRIVCTPPINS